MGATAMETAMKVSNGDEGDGGGDNGGGRATVTRVEGRRQWQGRQERFLRQKVGDAWKRAMVRAARAMAMATRVAGDDEGEGVEEGDEDEEGDGDGDVGGGWRVSKRAMVTVAGAMAAAAEAMATVTTPMLTNVVFFHSGVN